MNQSITHAGFIHHDANQPPGYDKIDQTNFVALATKNLFKDSDGQFYFTDETSEAHGPYATEFDAESHLEAYILTLHVPKGLHGAAILGMMFAGEDGVGKGIDLLSAAGKIYTYAEYQAELDNIIYAVDDACDSVATDDYSRDDAKIDFAAAVLGHELARADEEDLIARVKVGRFMSIKSVDHAADYLRNYFFTKAFIETKNEDGNPIFVGKRDHLIPEACRMCLEFLQHNAEGEKEESHKKLAAESITLKQVEHRASVLLAWAITQILINVKQGTAEEKMVQVGEILMPLTLGKQGGLASLLEMISHGKPAMEDAGDFTNLLTKLITKFCLEHTHNDAGECINAWVKSGELALKDAIMASITRANQ